MALCTAHGAEHETRNPGCITLIKPLLDQKTGLHIENFGLRVNQYKKPEIAETFFIHKNLRNSLVN